ncbi:hypothetical protein RF11_14577 [Thelohanellus kitauei]|uniref:Uncharacterized protein n=1 Tax=Thelohanellus kitauei TaxID=669202 RepID=A0A0C2MN66_THEKT|nr:hypothetical protein RF11_14577 [Thelohanellus kitauei]
MNQKKNSGLIFIVYASSSISFHAAIQTIAVFYDLKQFKKLSIVNRHNNDFTNSQQSWIVFTGRATRFAIYCSIHTYKPHRGAFLRWKRYAKSGTPENETESFECMTQGLVTITREDCDDYYRHINNYMKWSINN